MEGISLKGDFAQRRSEWSTAENKAVCAECENTDRFKAQCSIWQKKKEKWDGEGLAEKEKGMSERKSKREIGSTRVSGRGETDPRNTETPENEVNSACRHINLPNVLGAMDGKERTGEMNVLTLAIQALMGEDCVVFHG